MKKALWTLVLAGLVMTLLLAACQPAAAPADNSAAYPAPAQGEAYPAPALAVAVATGPYPGPADKASGLATWDQVAAAFIEGKIAQVYQAPTGHVTLVFKDSVVWTILEPQVDEVFKLIEACGEVCKDIEVIKQ